MSAVRPIKIGFIGAGGIAKSRHLPNLAKIEGVSVDVVCNRSVESSRKVADEWHIPRIAPDWRAVVEDPEIDAVFIGTQPYMHKEISIAALEAGKHVFCQARMAMDAREAHAMADAARRAAAKGLKAQLCLPPHCLSVDGLMRRLIQKENVLGTLTHAAAHLPEKGYLNPDAPLHWRQIWRISGYNTLALGIYAEVIHRWIGYFRRVQAMVHTHTKQRRVDESGRMAPVERPEVVLINAEHESGAIMSWHMSGLARPRESFIEFHGTHGSIRHNIGERAVWVNRGQEWERIELAPEEETRWTAEEDFIRSIREDASIFYPNPTFDDGVRYMEFTEAVFRSAASGRTVTLPLEV